MMKAGRFPNGASIKQEKQIADDIQALKQMKDSAIDTSDIPSTTDWSRAKKGKFFRPVQSIAHSGVNSWAWPKNEATGRQTHLNTFQRGPMERLLVYLRAKWDAFATRHPWFESAVGIGLCVVACVLDAMFSKEVKPRF